MTNTNHLKNVPDSGEFVPRVLSEEELKEVTAKLRGVEDRTWEVKEDTRARLIPEAERNAHTIPLDKVQKAAARRIQYSRPKDQSYDSQAHQHSNRMFNRQEGNR